MRFVKWAFNKKQGHFFFLLVAIWLGLETNHEKQIFNNLAQAVKTNSANKNDTALILCALEKTWNLMHQRATIFRGLEKLSINQKLFGGADKDLMYGSGACGGYSMVFANTLKTMGLPVRIAQLKLTNGVWGGHIVIEYYSSTLNKWVMIDPLFQYVAHTQSGWLNAKEAAQQWEQLEEVPQELYSKFRFVDVRYTNWDKYHGLFKPLRWLLRIIRGEEYTSTFSMRVYLLNKVQWLFVPFFVLYGYYWWVLSIQYLKHEQRRAARLGFNH